MADSDKLICRTWSGIADFLYVQALTGTKTAAYRRYMRQWQQEMEALRSVFEEGEIGLLHTAVPYMWRLFDGDLCVATSSRPSHLIEYALNGEHCVSDGFKGRCLTLRLMYSMENYLKLEGSIPNDPGTI